ncbi:hypothetical protein K431DRAFT_314824 [Polychaeton citri CBS 116435]|uniref:WD40 repeat-like protein n=1 Tax=Polychaeton citri CBS 116435 TaxID=1314669 RepID=A0A9P4Q2D9_9PEZI|nr:hypothetical protein K431DRAFT_314824 [Polychaeton citri CBS 116435]
MNLGSIPGYYYDEEKQKYFKVLKNHNTLPSASRYSKQNIRREQQDTKKRKRQQLDEATRKAKTVTLPPIITNPIVSGIGLERELGSTRPSTIALRRDAAHMSRLKPMVTYTYPKKGPHQDAAFQKISPFQEGHCGLLAYNSHGRGYLVPIFHPLDSHSRSDDDFLYSEMIGLRGEITSVAVSDKHFAATSLGLNTLLAGELCHHDPTYGRVQEYPSTSPSAITLSDDIETSLWQCKIMGNLTAVGSSKTVHCADVETKEVFHMDQTGSYRALDWLDHRIIAAGQSNGGFHNHVALWDTRTNGTSMRFRRTERLKGVRNVSNNVTGVLAANGSGFQLLTSTHNCINLFDTRYPKDNHPLLQIEHQHVSPMLVFATDGSGVVAAVDSQENPIAYSLINGKELEILTQDSLSGGARINSLQFLDDLNGSPTVVACTRNNIIAWKHGGSLAATDEHEECDI